MPLLDLPALWRDLGMLRILKGTYSLLQRQGTLLPSISDLILALSVMLNSSSVGGAGA